MVPHWDKMADHLLQFAPVTSEQRIFFLKGLVTIITSKKYMTTLLRRLLNNSFLSTKQLDFTMYLKGFLNKCNWFLKNFKDMLLHGGRNSVTITLKTLSENWKSLNVGLHELLVHEKLPCSHSSSSRATVHDLNDYLTVRSWVKTGVGLWWLGFGFHDMSPIQN